jgi:hypothetical protein
MSPVFFIVSVLLILNVATHDWCSASALKFRMNPESRYGLYRIGWAESDESRRTVAVVHEDILKNLGVDFCYSGDDIAERLMDEGSAFDRLYDWQIAAESKEGMEDFFAFLDSIDVAFENPNDTFGVIFSHSNLWSMIENLKSTKAGGESTPVDKIVTAIELRNSDQEVKELAEQIWNVLQGKQLVYENKFRVTIYSNIASLLAGHYVSKRVNRDVEKVGRLNLDDRSKTLYRNATTKIHHSHYVQMVWYLFGQFSNLKTEEEYNTWWSDELSKKESKPQRSFFDSAPEDLCERCFAEDMKFVEVFYDGDLSPRRDDESTQHPKNARTETADQAPEKKADEGTRKTHAYILRNLLPGSCFRGVYAAGGSCFAEDGELSPDALAKNIEKSARQRFAQINKKMAFTWKNADAKDMRDFEKSLYKALKDGVFAKIFSFQNFEEMKNKLSNEKNEVAIMKIQTAIEAQWRAQDFTFLRSGVQTQTDELVEQIRAIILGETSVVLNTAEKPQPVLNGVISDSVDRQAKADIFSTIAAMLAGNYLLTLDWLEDLRMDWAKDMMPTHARIREGGFVLREPLQTEAQQVTEEKDMTVQTEAQQVTEEKKQSSHETSQAHFSLKDFREMKNKLPVSLGKYIDYVDMAKWVFGHFFPSREAQPFDSGDSNFLDREYRRQKGKGSSGKSSGDRTVFDLAPAVKQRDEWLHESMSFVVAFAPEGSLFSRSVATLPEMRKTLDSSTIDPM